MPAPNARGQARQLRARNALEIGMKRILTFGIVVMAVWALETWWLNSRQANTSTTFALQQQTE